ncbi:MAG: hypothetical protein A2126_00550 [Candidatus Woykebacteria bacterium GWB1_45_5]|uniref:Excinuclease ABC subunit C n=1 Tax=Candidatus Woykebacteria bacterium GWB1_45_5 TaxID=1802592 RepID=A0A1G1W8B3_9BACT|nr:MAG: hypothetical protein A2126_00550 [Candidatus Woykebacteria bacterium GWB1_45_5]
MKFNFPEAPGVYIFKDKRGKPLYIGKAVNIKKRIKSHFSPRGALTKGRNLLEKTTNVEAIVVDSEIEALILEANLIKKFKPHFNAQLKDDKDYLYIKITTDRFPKVLTGRKKDLISAKIYFGPFPSATKVRETLRTLRRVFPYSICKPNQKRACLHYHLGLCPGVCVGKINEGDYWKNIKALVLFLKGQKIKVINDLQRELGRYSKNQRFEEAASIQKKIEALYYITKPTRSIFEYLEEDPRKLREKELKDLAKILGLAVQPRRIECFDISNIGGKEAAGSMVVLTDGGADKDEYRRFKIKKIKGANDPAMLAEVINRRFKHNWPKPDLLVVDGGRGQLNATLSVLNQQNLEIPSVGLAKRFEELYLPERKRPLRISRQSDALKLIQRVRDEAHRFALRYHRSLRRKATFD